MLEKVESDAYAKLRLFNDEQLSGQHRVRTSLCGDVADVMVDVIKSEKHLDMHHVQKGAFKEIPLFETALLQKYK